MIEEEWAPIKHYEGVYEVSTLGRIKRIKRGPATRPGFILKPKKMKNGYEMVTLFYSGMSSQFLLHRLVLTAFIGPPRQDQETNHIDGVKDNNKLENLEWVTRSVNQLHKCYSLGHQIGRNHYTHQNGHIGPYHHGSKHWIVTDPNGVEYTVHGLKAFCEANGLRSSPMGEVASGKYTHYKGWKCKQVNK